MSHRENHTQDVAPASSPVIGALPDFKAAYIEDELNEKLEEAFHQHTSQIVLHEVAKIASEHDPIDLAHAVAKLPPHARVVVYNNLPDLQAKIIFMINTGNNTRSAIFKQIEDGEIKKLIEGMPIDEAVWVLDDLSDRRIKRILELLEPKKASRIKELQKHDRYSAGRLMTNEFFSFPMETTIGEVASQVRNNPGIELTGRIFVVKEDNALVAYVPERNLIINPPYLPIRQVMQPILHKVHPDTSRDEVVDIVERYNIPALPVVNLDNRLVGVIAYEDALEAMKDIADETIANIAGTAENYEEDERILTRFFGRAPWLLVTLCAGLVTAMAMSHFREKTWFILVPFFVPLIAGMSGNVGIQCSTLVVRGMSTGSLSYGSILETIRKELSIGLLIGSVFGLACGTVVYILNYIGIHPLESNSLALGIMVSLGVLTACIVATCLGTFSPFFFARFKIDPAVAAGPIVTACNDVLSTLVFFLVARLVYVWFF